MLDDREQKIVDDIARVGWSLIGVKETYEAPSFVYSIGMMQTLGHPEVIIFGLDVELMARIVNYIGEEIRTGRPFTEPGLYEGLIERFACKFLPVNKCHHADYFGFALWHRWHLGQAGTLEAMQCLWPDKQGLFPDEPGCNIEMARRQPLLDDRAQSM